MTGAARTSDAPKRAQRQVPDAWKRFVRAHAAVTRQMDADLIASHGLTLSDYEVLLRLSQAPDRRMRRVDLAQERAAHAVGDHATARGPREGGLGRPRELRQRPPGRLRGAHGRGLREAARGRRRRTSRASGQLFSSRFSGEELETLAGLLGALAARPATKQASARSMATAR